MEVDHRVFLNLTTRRFYCLPDNYEVIDASLEDIKFNLAPSFTREQIATMNAGVPSTGAHEATETEAEALALMQTRALDNKLYLPGVVGLNNMKANDYVNVVVQVLTRVGPVRDFFLDEDNYRGVRDPLVTTFGELVRKMYNPR